MKQVIAIFDIGKTNKKLILFDTNFEIVSQFEQNFKTICDEDGFECDDIDLITDWIYHSLVEIVSGNQFDLLAVNFSTYGASLIFLDENGKRLTPLYNYLKPVDKNFSAKLFEKYGDKDHFCRKTASPDLGLLLNSGIQILWLNQEKPDTFLKVRHILHFPQYLSFRLTGQINSEPTSIGCHTFLWDYDLIKYHKWITDYNIKLPELVYNNQVFKSTINGKEFLTGTGIHDSSASLVPYLKTCNEKFILVSTGTWCINMNPFNHEPLTNYQLENDCLCFLSPEMKQVKSSRLFMGHFHDTWLEKISAYFKIASDHFKKLNLDGENIEQAFRKYKDKKVYFPLGKESFEKVLDDFNFGIFTSYKEAYLQLLIELSNLCVDSINLIIGKPNEIEKLYVTGGFTKNEIFVYLLKLQFPGIEVIVKHLTNSSALGAAMAIADTLNLKINKQITKVAQF